MKPRIVERGPFHVVGVRERFAPGHIEAIPLLWERFVPFAPELPNKVPDVLYGVCVDGTDPAAEEPGFEYTACSEVTTLDDIPEGMVGFTVPGGTFAVFTHRGPVSQLADSVRTVWRELLPAEGLKPTGAPDFELYDERFRGEEPDCEVDIYVPVVAPA